MEPRQRSATSPFGVNEKTYSYSRTAPPSISICIPTYNRGYCLANAIESAINTIDNETEILVVDNASSDETQLVIDRIGHPSIRNIKFDSNVSMYANHNRCIEIARGKWVLFLHSDDTLCKGAISTIRNHLKYVNDVDMIFPKSSLHRTLNQTEESIYLDSEKGVGFFCRFPAGTPSGCLYKRQSLLTSEFPTELVAADLALIFNWFFGSRSCLVTRNEIVNISHNDSQFSSSWVQSGRNIHDVGKVMKMIFGSRSEWLIKHIAPQMNSWKPFEIARFLMYLAHAGMFNAISKLEKQVADKSYRCDRHYKHVALGKAIGSEMLWASVVASKKLKSFIPKKNRSEKA